MRKITIVFAVLFVMMIGALPVSAQETGDIIIQPEGLVYTIIGTLVGALAGAGALYYKLSGKKASEKLDEDSRNGMLGFLLIGGWLASMIPGEWEEQQLAKIMESIGLNKPVWNIPPTTQSAPHMADQWGLKHKPVQNNPPPTDSSGMWARDMTHDPTENQSFNVTVNSESVEFNPSAIGDKDTFG